MSVSGPAGRVARDTAERSRARRVADYGKVTDASDAELEIGGVSFSVCSVRVEADDELEMSEAVNVLQMLYA